MNDINYVYHCDNPKAVGISLVVNGKWLRRHDVSFFVPGDASPLTPRQASYIAHSILADWYRETWNERRENEDVDDEN